MSFRDDRDAQAERVARLEQELDAARATIARLEQSARELDATQRELRATKDERDRLQRGVAPVVARLRTMFVAFVLVIVAANFVLYVVQDSERANERGRCAAEIEAREGQANVAQEALQQALNEARDLRAQLAAVPVAPPPPPPEPLPEGISTTGVVSARSGHAAPRMGDPCSVDIAYQPATHDCHASVACGGHALYPQDGAGFFGCEIVDGHVARGVDTNPTSVSRDPEIDVDRERGTIVVTDTEPDWSVTVRIARPNPF